MPDEKNKISKAQKRAVQKYVRDHYDRIEVRAPKGYREKIQEHADAVDESVNVYIKKAVDARMQSEDDASQSQ